MQDFQLLIQHFCSMNGLNVFKTPPHFYIDLLGNEKKHHHEVSDGDNGMTSAVQNDYFMDKSLLGWDEQLYLDDYQSSISMKRAYLLWIRRSKKLSMHAQSSSKWH